MNGLQRLLIGAWMYVDLPAGFRDIGRLQKIQDKDGAAQLMTEIFGDFDQEFEEMGIKYEPSPPKSS